MICILRKLACPGEGNLTIFSCPDSGAFDYVARPHRRGFDDFFFFFAKIQMHDVLSGGGGMSAL